MSEQMIEQNERADDAAHRGTASVVPRAPWRHRLGRADGLVAVVTWLLGLAVAAAVVKVADQDPFTMAGAVMPVAVGSAVAVVFVVFLLRRQLHDVAVGAALGAYAAWIGLVVATTLHGTPFGYSGMGNDEGRLVAQATKYMTSWRPVDAFVHNLSTEYPPLYPWLIGHTAAIVHRPAWTLFGEAQILTMSG